MAAPRGCRRPWAAPAKCSAPAPASSQPGRAALPQPTIACVTLLLISGRPGAGKTEFCRWLQDTYNFIHVDTDARPQILYSLVVQTAIEAQATKEYMLGLGSDVVVEWGFIPDFLGSVRLLKLVGFDAWWFDADEATARELWRRVGDALSLHPGCAISECPGV